MALIPCRECKAQIFSKADKCPQCGVNNPCVSYEEEELLREEQRKIDTKVSEILRLGAQKKDAYARLDDLQGELFQDGLIPFLRNVFPSAGRKAKLKKKEDTVREIYSLRARMDQLLDLLPSDRRNEVDHLWNYENTTSPFLQRKARNG